MPPRVCRSARPRVSPGHSRCAPGSALPVVGRSYFTPCSIVEIRKSGHGRYGLPMPSIPASQNSAGGRVQYGCSLEDRLSNPYSLLLLSQPVYQYHAQSCPPAARVYSSFFIESPLSGRQKRMTSLHRYAMISTLQPSSFSASHSRIFATARSFQAPPSPSNRAALASSSKRRMNGLSGWSTS